MFLETIGNSSSSGNPANFLLEGICLTGTITFLDSCVMNLLQLVT